MIYLVECCMVVVIWYFSFCHLKPQSPSIEPGQESDSLQATRIRESRAMLPKAFLQLRNQLSALIQSDGSPHVRMVAFSSYMTVMQVAIGVSEGLNVEGDGREAAPPLPPGSVLKEVSD